MPTTVAVSQYLVTRYLVLSSVPPQKVFVRVLHPESMLFDGVRCPEVVSPRMMTVLPTVLLMMVALSMVLATVLRVRRHRRRRSAC